MLFDFANVSPRDRYKLLVSTVTPRPIAWIVSQDLDGVVNAAPFSFFNVVAGDPPVVAIGIASHEPGRPKDTRANILATGQFVVNLVSEDNAQQMNITAIAFPPGVDEMQEAGLTPHPSIRVKPPRISESPVAMECELVQIVDLGESGLVLGRVVAMHIHDDLVLDASRCYIDTPGLKLLGRMHGTGWYSRPSDLFDMPRIAPDEWKEKKASMDQADKS
jgi:flavin reductase (DIM6/NTAB) family NADH-FMN oxidoreductase RutF